MMSNQKKILVIDDEKNIRETLSELLVFCDYEVIIAKNGLEGIESAEQQSPDLIICDIMMPELDGYEVAKRIRRNDKMAMIPFIFLSAKSSNHDFRKGLGLGADDYLIKPFSNQELIDTVAMRLERVKSIKSDNKNLKDSINNAKNIQNVILPKDDEIRKVFQKNFKIYMPRDVVSGDFFWMNEGNSHSHLAVADCTGHGGPGAMLSMVCYEKLNAVAAINKDISPGNLLTMVNGMIYDFMLSHNNEAPIRDGMDIAMCMIDKKQQTLSFSGAARPLYIITEQKLEEGDLLIKHNSDGKRALYELKGDIYSIGASNRNHVFTEQTIPIVKSDRVFLFSDGYTDQFGGEKDKKYNRLRLRNTLLSSHELSIEDQKNLLEKELHDWMGKQEQTDDITLMALEI